MPEQGLDIYEFGPGLQ